VICSGGCVSRRVPMGSRANKYLIAITDGHSAMQDEGTNVVFLHTTVGHGDHFQQILAWTLKSRWQQPRTLSGLRQITGTFHCEK